MGVLWMVVFNVLCARIRFGEHKLGMMGVGFGVVASR